MKNEYDTKSLIITVMILVVFLCIVTLWIVYHGTPESEMPGWIRWILD